MAKKVIQSLVEIPISQIVSIREDNVDRIRSKYFKDDKERSVLIVSLLKGYKPELGIVVVSPLSVEDKKRAEKQVREDIASLRSEDKPFGIRLLLGEADTKTDREIRSIAIAEYMEQTFFDKKGNFLPIYGTVSANRRTSILPYVVLFQRLCDFSETVNLPCQIREYSSKDERIADLILENELKTDGMKPVSPSDIVATAWGFYHNGATKQSAMRRIYKVGTAQKNYWLCELLNYIINKFPKVSIEEMIDTFGETEGYKYGALNYKRLKEVKEKNPSTFEEIDAFLRNPNPEGSKAKTFKAEDLKALTTYGFVLVSKVINGVLNNDFKVLDNYKPLKKELNESFLSLCSKYKIDQEEEKEEEVTQE